jgi:hypothetical protein
MKWACPVSARDAGILPGQSVESAEWDLIMSATMILDYANNESLYILAA